MHQKMDHVHFPKPPYLDKEGNNNQPNGILCGNGDDTTIGKDVQAMMKADLDIKGKIVSNMDLIVAEGTHLILQIATSNGDTRVLVLPPGVVSITTVSSHSLSI